MLRSYYQFAGENRHFLLFGLLTAFFGNYGQSFFIAWFGESFQNAFALSKTEYGSLYSLATLISGFLILYVGGLLDKTPLKKFTLLTLLGFVAACFLVYFAELKWQLLLALFLLRFCGQGLMFHIAFTSMARYFNENRGKAIGIVGFGMPLGEIILPTLVITLLTQIGWRETWLVLALTLLMLYLPTMIWLLHKSHARLEQFNQQTNLNTNTKLSWSRKQVIRDPRFWFLIPAIMTPAFVVTGLFIHQAVLLDAKLWQPEWFALSFVFYGISHSKSSFVIGSLVDKYSGIKLFRFYLAPMLLALLLLATPLNDQIIAIIFMFLIGLTIGASGPIVGSLWVEIYGNQSIGAIRSMVTSIMVVSTAVSPILFGWLFDQGTRFNHLMIYLSIYMLLAWFMANYALAKKVE